MKKIVLLIFLSILLLSCKKNSIDTQLLIGDWEFVPIKIGDKNSNSYTEYYYSDFSIDKDSIFDSLDGFIKRDSRSTNSISTTRYFNGKTKYFVRKDSLYVLSPISKKFNAIFFIKKVTKDSLIAKADNGTPDLVFIKKKFEQGKNVEIDQIIVSNGSCFGTCPVNSTSISKAGELYFYGEAYNSKNGLFQGKINPKTFQEISNYLNKINFINLKDDYGRYNVTDLEHSYITFVNIGKIIKTIHDYGSASPKELIATINKISYLYQEAKLDSIPYTLPIINRHLGNISLKQSEAFYLQTLIMNAPITNEQFKPVYSETAMLIMPSNFNYDNYDELERNVETDGRFFKMEDKNMHFVTYDLGYNFFERNKVFK